MMQRLAIYVFVHNWMHVLFFCFVGNIRNLFGSLSAQETSNIYYELLAIYLLKFIGKMYNKIYSRSKPYILLLNLDLIHCRVSKQIYSQCYCGKDVEKCYQLLRTLLHEFYVTVYVTVWFNYQWYLLYIQLTLLSCRARSVWQLPQDTDPLT